MKPNHSSGPGTAAEHARPAEARTPTSILFFKSAEQARTETSAALGKAMRDLEVAWGANELLPIAQEVLKALGSK